MFGFDGATAGFEKILNDYVINHEKYTHKDIRAYARCLLAVLPEMNIDKRVKPEVETLLAALSASKLAHYDRVFLARCILKLLQESNKPAEKATSDIF